MTIEDMANTPKRVTTDEGTIVERSIKELIDAEMHEAAQEVPDQPLHGLRISRCKPAGPM
jgi:hypothetical protein